jgi:hypothetical protein
MNVEVVHVGALHFLIQNSLIDIRYFVVVKTGFYSVSRINTYFILYNLIYL